jgi:hypothetical protein
MADRGAGQAQGAEARTLLNSGNAGKSPAPPLGTQRREDEGDSAATGLDVPVIVKSAQQLQPSSTAMRWHRRWSIRLDRWWCLRPMPRDRVLVGADALLAPDERFHLTGTGYLLCSAGILQSKAAQALLGKVGRL